MTLQENLDELFNPHPTAKAAFEDNPNPQTAAAYLEAVLEADVSDDIFLNSIAEVRDWLANLTPEDLIRMIPNARVDTLRNGPDFKVWRVQVEA